MRHRFSFTIYTRRMDDPVSLLTVRRPIFSKIFGLDTFSSINYWDLATGGSQPLQLPVALRSPVGGRHVSVTRRSFDTYGRSRRWSGGRSTSVFFWYSVFGIKTVSWRILQRKPRVPVTKPATNMGSIFISKISISWNK